MDARPREVRIFEFNGKRPYSEWTKKLDPVTRQKIRIRTNRLEDGNFGDHGPVGQGVFELRIHFGPGYRVYFGLDGDEIVLLLSGGDKSSQARDIRTAILYCREYKR